MKYVYPCLLIPEEAGGYSVIFPDIAGGTQGETLYEALEMGEELLRLMLTTAIEDGEKIPVPSKVSEVEVPMGAILTLIKADTEKIGGQVA